MSVIVPTRNGGKDIRGLIDALADQTIGRERFEVVVGDDGSTDGSTTELATDDGWIRVVTGPPRNSYAARNRAVAASCAPVLAFCDVDCRPDPGWLEAGLAALERTDVVAGSIRFIVPQRRTVWTLLDMDMFLDQERAVRSGAGITANLFVRRDRFDAIGGFDDSLASGGDADLVQRATAAGARLGFEQAAVVWHPTRDGARPFLRKVWRTQRAFAARVARTGGRPVALHPSYWAPLLGMVRARGRLGRTLRLDRRRLADSGVVPTMREDVLALLVIAVLPYVVGAAQLRGWREWRKDAAARANERADVVLVCSTGGHLLQLRALDPAWKTRSRLWITFDKSDARSLLAAERVVFAHGPTNRNVPNLFRNLFLALRVLRSARPRVIVTTGAGVAVPFCWIGRLLGARVVYVESFTRIDQPSLSLRLISPVADRVYVQWAELQAGVRGSRYVGSIFS